MAETDGTGQDRGRAASADEAQARERLRAFGRKLDAARHDEDPGKRPGASSSSLLGMAFRIATELVAGLALGGFIGWQLDRWLGTRPVFLLIFIGLGAAGAFLNIFRYANRMHAAARAGADRNAAAGAPHKTQGGE